MTRYRQYGRSVRRSPFPLSLLMGIALKKHTTISPLTGATQGDHILARNEARSLLQHGSLEIASQQYWSFRSRMGGCAKRRIPIIHLPSE